jgi:membrane-associated phospholipid phosphatase
VIVVIMICIAALSLILLDRPVAAWVLAQGDGLRSIAELVSTLAGPWTVLTVLSALALVDWLRRRAETSFGLAASARQPWPGLLARGALALVVTLALKSLVGRARPDVVFDPYIFAPFATPDASLPSTQAAVIVALAIGIGSQWPRWRTVAVILACIAAGSRVLAGDHWLSDVIVGGVVGWICGRPWPAMERLRRPPGRAGW